MAPRGCRTDGTSTAVSSLWRDSSDPRSSTLLTKFFLLLRLDAFMMQGLQMAAVTEHLQTMTGRVKSPDEAGRV